MLDKRMNRVMGFRLVLVLVVIIGLFAVYLALNSKKMQITLNNTYERAFYDLVEYADNVEVALAKAQISSSPEYGAKNLSDIWRKSDLAVNALAQIPMTHEVLDLAEKFLNQLSDYAYSLAQKTFKQEALTESDLSNMQKLYTRCKSLNQTLKDLAAGLQNGSISWKELTKTKNADDIFAQEVANLSVDSFSQIEKDMQDYEGLIYDGPFSEHMTNPQMMGLGKTYYTKEMAEDVLQEYIPSGEIAKIDYQGVVDGKIRAHHFDVWMKNGEICYMDITERDGKVLYMSIPRIPSVAQIKKEEANQIAIDYLKKHGFGTMKESYYTNENNMLTINYAYVQDGVICYPDLVKVKVALDNGEVLGLETKSYLSSHHERMLKNPKVSIEEAQKKINSNLEILSEGRAIIPTDFQTEVEVYEFKGRVGENNFIVYVNAETGKEEKIFMIVDTPGGELAI